MSHSVLVIGGGIAGIQASLDLANAGAQVVLVERAPTIGGVMAALDKNFPTLDCSICIEAPKMSEVDLHPNIEILSPAEVERLEGKAGDFEVHIRGRSRFVTDECTRCGDCVQACPVVLPNEFDSGMASRKAIYTPIPQSVPGAYLVDIDHCLNNPPNYIPCNRCVEVCPPKAIDFMMPRERKISRKVAAVIVAVGYDSFDPRALQEFGYASHPDVLSALEFERLINSAGPTGGEILRPSNGAHPAQILFVLCVGSRDERHLRYCSRFCCMYSVKHAYQAIDHGVASVDVLYMDVRAYGKGFDAFWQRTAEGGARFLRGRPAEIAPNGDGAVRVIYEDTERGSRVTGDYDMVVLANAATPAQGLPELAERLGIALDADGFVQARELEGGLMITTREGVYVAGCASGPKDIPDSVAEGSGSASLALAHVSERSWPTPPEIPPLEGVADPRVGVFVCHCGSNIAGVVDVGKVVEHALTLPDVVYASDQMFSCAGNTQAEIETAIRSQGLNRVVVAACSPKTHESIFRGVLVRAGLNPYLLEMANIRNMDSWVHKFDPQAATEKAKDMVWMAVEKARRLAPLEGTQLALAGRVLVVGGGIAGLSAALSADGQGFETDLVERTESLGGLINQLGEIWPAGIGAGDLVRAKIKALENSGVHLHLGTQVETIEGVVGDFRAHLSSGEDLRAGAVIIATGAQPYQPQEFGFRSDERVITNLELEEILRRGGPGADRVTFVSCVGSRQEGRGCARYCCTSMIGQALRLRKMGVRVKVLYKDIRTYSRGAEELYEQAMRAGVQFLRYDPDSAPQDAICYQDGMVELYDHLLGAAVRFATDLLVLVVGLRPAEDDLSAQLKLAHSEDGFLMELHPKLGPAETASQGIYLAGAAQGPKDVRESVAQALAAAGKAGALLSRGVIEKEPLTAVVNEELCIGCMRCIKVCPFGALEATGPVKEGVVRVIEAACMGCGTCAAECNFDAIDMPYFTKGQILAQVEAALAEDPGSKCLVFTCNWCSYAGADLAGIEKRQYPASARIVRTMCSARFEEAFIERAFELGAGAVLVTGCRLTETGSDCHYNYANRLTWKRFRHWQRKYARKGIEADRLQLQWVSAAEGKEFARKIGEMDEVIAAYRSGHKAQDPTAMQAR
jgi:heterodisulfide reductase subunit A